jgi:tetratricopeptide (TPR) repeat protein
MVTIARFVSTHIRRLANRFPGSQVKEEKQRTEHSMRKCNLWIAVFCSCGAAAQAASPPPEEPWEIARRQGNYPDAKRLLHEALANPGAQSDIRRVELEDELASVCQILGDMSEAERLFADLENILHTNPAIGLATQSIVRGDIGLFRARQGRLDDAADVLEAALATSRRALGDRGAGTAALESDLGQVFVLEGKLRDAEPLLRAAVDVLRKDLPAGHLDRIVAETSLGSLYMIEGRFDNAEPVLQQANNEARGLGESHPAYAAALAALADLYRLEGKSARGAPLLKKAQAIYEASFGEDSPRVAEIMLDRSIDDIVAKKFSLAETEVTKALDILRITQGAEHPTVALAEFRLAKVRAGQQRYPEAEQLLEHAIAVQEKTWPEGHFPLGDSLFGLAEVQRLERRYAEAQVNYRKAIGVYEKSGRLDAPGLVAARQHLNSQAR